MGRRKSPATPLQENKIVAVGCSSFYFYFPVGNVLWPIASFPRCHRSKNTPHFKGMKLFCILFQNQIFRTTLYLTTQVFFKCMISMKCIIMFWHTVDIYLSITVKLVVFLWFRHTCRRHVICCISITMERFPRERPTNNCGRHRKSNRYRVENDLIIIILDLSVNCYFKMNVRLIKTRYDFYRVSFWVIVNPKLPDIVLTRPLHIILQQIVKSTIDKVPLQRSCHVMEFMVIDW